MYRLNFMLIFLMISIFLCAESWEEPVKIRDHKRNIFSDTRIINNKIFCFWTLREGSNTKLQMQKTNYEGESTLPNSEPVTIIEEDFGFIPNYSILEDDNFIYLSWITKFHNSIRFSINKFDLEGSSIWETIYFESDNEVFFSDTLSFTETFKVDEKIVTVWNFWDNIHALYVSENGTNIQYFEDIHEINIESPKHFFCEKDNMIHIFKPNEELDYYQLDTQGNFSYIDSYEIPHNHSCLIKEVKDTNTNQIKTYITSGSSNETYVFELTEEGLTYFTTVNHKFRENNFISFNDRFATIRKSISNTNHGHYDLSIFDSDLNEIIHYDALFLEHISSAKLIASDNLFYCVNQAINYGFYKFNYDAELVCSDILDMNQFNSFSATDENLIHFSNNYFDGPYLTVYNDNNNIFTNVFTSPNLGIVDDFTSCQGENSSLFLWMENRRNGNFVCRYQIKDINGDTIINENLVQYSAGYCQNINYDIGVSYNDSRYFLCWYDYQDQKLKYYIVNENGNLEVDSEYLENENPTDSFNGPLTVSCFDTGFKVITPMDKYYLQIFLNNEPQYSGFGLEFCEIDNNIIFTENYILEEDELTFLGNNGEIMWQNSFENIHTDFLIKKIQFEENLILINKRINEYYIDVISPDNEVIYSNNIEGLNSSHFYHIDYPSNEYLFLFIEEASRNSYFLMEVNLETFNVNIMDFHVEIPPGTQHFHRFNDNYLFFYVDYMDDYLKYNLLDSTGNIIDNQIVLSEGVSCSELNRISETAFQVSFRSYFHENWLFGNWQPYGDFGLYTYYFELPSTYIDVNEESLSPNNLSIYPNPFNLASKSRSNLLNIEYYSPKDQTEIDVSIYNLKGQKIKNLLSKKLSKGNHTISWDGKDSYGELVSSGVYFYKLDVNNQNVAVKKCVVVR